MIPYGRQDITQSDIDAVVSVLNSDFLTQGPKVPEFEDAIKTYCGVKYALAMNSATSALHVACLALGVGPGDIVWTSPVTFVASSNCALYCGAEVDFVDIDPLTYNMSVASLEKKLIQAKKDNNLPKVVIPVHLSGQSCDMEAISRLAKTYGFRIIEDASHAIGGRYLDRPVGSCAFSEITVFSFHPVKIITTAEGGLITTNDSDLHHKIQLLRSHGITRDPAHMTEASHGPWYYQQIELGFNYRMTELQAALGCSQMRRLDSYVSKRHEIFNDYVSQLAGLSFLKLPYLSPTSYSALHLFIVRLDVKALKKSHKEAFEELRAKGVGVNLHYIPVYLQPYYQNLGFKSGYCPEAETYYGTALSLPMFPTLTKKDIDQVCQALKEL